jgi:hypothetical protein
MTIYGGIRREPVDWDAPVPLDSGVTLAEAVKVWAESLSRAIKQARLCPEWVWHFRVCAWKRSKVAMDA